MNFLNLSLGELIGVAGAISAGVVALYLLDRSKRRQVVSTLRFWTPADSRTEMKHRKRIQQPWSLLLQILSLLFLLIALAGPRLGSDDTGRDHVVIVDTSAWMGARTGRTSLMDEARAAARAYVKALPSRDRVMLVRADALATPVTAFEGDRQILNDAIQHSQPGASALNLPQAIEFAQRAQKLQAQHAGEIVYAGAARLPQDEATFAIPANFRFLEAAGTPENVGLRKVGLRRSTSTPDTWDIFVALKNYGIRPRDVGLELQFGGAPAGSKSFSLKPGEEQQASFTYKTRAAGYLEARLNSRDAFPQDDRAVVELPSEKPLRVMVYSNEPALLKPLIASNTQVTATFESPAKYDPKVKADLVILDRFAPSARPQVSSIWIEPPPAGSPIAVKGTHNGVKLASWRTDTPLGAGLRTQDVLLATAETFSLAPGDIPVAESAEGPLIVARPGSPKIVAMGFQPVKSSMKYELATPLLFANTLRWMAPDVFRTREVEAGTVGTVTVPVEKGTDPASVRVFTEDSRPLPFTIEDNVLRFFCGAPGTVRVLTGNRELVYSLTLPDVGDTVWKAPATVHRGIPRSMGNGVTSTDIWPWFAVLGAFGLLLDWLLFGRSRAFRLKTAGIAIGSLWRKAS